MTVRADTNVRRQQLFDEAASIIAVEYASDLTLEAVARRLYTSRRQLQRAFAEAGSASFRKHLCRVRVERAAKLLTEGSTVREAARAVGYRQPAQFAKAFRRRYGTSPSVMRLGGHRGSSMR